MKTILIETRIAAPPDRVWAIVADFAAYPTWNPCLTAIEGEQRVGAPLVIRVHAGGKDTMLKAKMTVWQPGRALRWVGGIPVLLRGEHFIETLPDGDGTLLRHGETFSGLASPLVPASVLAGFETGYAAMNAALKARAEAG